MLHIAATGVIAAWALIVACQLQLPPDGERGHAAARNSGCRFLFQRLSDAGFLAGVLI